MYRVGGTGVMYWPERTIFPYGGGTSVDARINACLSKCDTTTDPFTWSPAGHNLTKFVDTMQELFYHTSNGMCYLGTYRCTKAGVYTVDEFAEFSVLVSCKTYSVTCFSDSEWQFKEGIVKQSFPKPGQYKHASASDKNIVRNAYLDGSAKVEFIHLEFEFFNHEYFGALMELKEADSLERAAKLAKRKQAEEAERESALKEKKARFDSLVAILL